MSKTRLKSFFVIALAALGGIAYRFGGSANGKRWVREAGQGVCVCGAMAVLGFIHWSLALCFGMTWLESTYLKKKGTDAAWWNWALVGLVFGLIPLPYCIFTNSHWFGFGIRIIVCIGLTVLWQQVLSSIVVKAFHKTFGKDVIDECGRGFINIVTLPLLLLGV